MAFQDDVRLEIEAGRIPRRFKSAHLKMIRAGRPDYYRLGTGEYSTNTITTVPRNLSTRPDGTNPGDYVRKGRKPSFWWYGHGEFELISTGGDIADLSEDQESNEAVFEEEVCTDSERLPSPVDESLVREIYRIEGPSPARIIVRYLAEKPFQAYFRRRPVGSEKLGWGARLDAYFWPDQSHGWKVASERVKELSTCVQEAVRDIDTGVNEQIAAEHLLTVFREICKWGGVRVPESDASVLAPEVQGVLRALRKGQEPPSSCRVNSAWTKLYAFALPNECVIYDSRVATALISILDPVMNLISRKGDWHPYERLGKVAGRGGSRPRDTRWPWPNGYASWQSQMAANRLCRDVLNEVRQLSRSQPDFHKVNDPSPWTLREAEAVLFMEGY